MHFEFGECDEHEGVPLWAYPLIWYLAELREDFMSVQDSIAAYAERVTTVGTSLGTGIDGVKAVIEGLKAQIAAGESVDFTPLDTAVSGVEGKASELAGLVPAPEVAPVESA